jgi:hypothetical protein
MASLITHTSLLTWAAFVTLMFISTDANQTECTGVVPLKANASRDSLISPTQEHPSKMDCEWLITTDSNSTVVAIELLVFDLPCSGSYVEFYDGPSTNSSRIRFWCGDLDYGTLSSTNSDLTVVFHSDGLQANSSIFVLSYRAMTKHSPPTTSCKNVSLIATGTDQPLLSPNYPDWYFSNMDCVWHITADSESNLIRLKLNDFTLEKYQPNCTHDYVKIFYGPSATSGDFTLLCGYRTDDFYISNNSSLTVVFHSDQLNDFKGFNFSYTSYKKAPGPDNSPNYTVIIFVSVTCGLGLISMTITTVTCIKKRIARRQHGSTQNDALVSNSAKESSKSGFGYEHFDSPPPGSSNLSDEIPENS